MCEGIKTRMDSSDKEPYKTTGLFIKKGVIMMTKVFYIAISNNEVVNGSINVPASMCDYDIEKDIVWDIEDNYEDWYDAHIMHLTELHVVKCGTNPEGYKVLLNGTKIDSIGNVVFNYIDKNDNNEVIRYSI